jgi:hypothetical protein
MQPQPFTSGETLDLADQSGGLIYAGTLANQLAAGAWRLDALGAVG